MTRELALYLLLTAALCSALAGVFFLTPHNLTLLSLLAACSILSILVLVIPHILIAVEPEASKTPSYLL